MLSLSIHTSTTCSLVIKGKQIQTSCFERQIVRGRQGHFSDKKLHLGAKVQERMITESIPDYAKQSVSIPSVTAHSQVLHTPRMSISVSPLSILHLRSWGQWEDFTSHYTKKTQSSPKTNASPIKPVCDILYA